MPRMKKVEPKKPKSATQSERLAQALAVAAECNRSLGEEGKVYMGDDHVEVERIPTGILALDTITGGGIPRRQLTELFGEESSGKTLLALHAVASVQRAGGIAVWLKGEDFDPVWAKKQGVNVDQLIMVEVGVGDVALETARTFLVECNPDLLVIDSYQAFGTTREADSGVDSESYAGGGAPQMWGRFMRKVWSIFNAHKANTAIIGISQVRDPIGAFSPTGKPEPRPTQIRALKHWKAVAVMCKKGEPRYDDPKSEKRKISARQFSLRCVKNKTAAPERISSFWYNFRGEQLGIDRADEAIRLGKVYGLIEQRGGWLQGYDIRGQGEDDYKAKLVKSPTTMRALYTDILDASQQ